MNALSGDQRNAPGLLRVGLLVLLTVGLPASLGAQGASSRPNIIFILADDLGYGDLSSYGATAIQTPNIDRLAEEGVLFTDAHSPSSVCTPTRESPQLYNLARDTGEQTDVYAQHPETAKRLQQLLHKIRTEGRSR